MAYLGEGYKGAYDRFQKLRAKGEQLPREIEAEINGGVAWISRIEGKPLTQDIHAGRGLVPSEKALSLDRHRYEFLVDRAMLLVRAKGPKDAQAEIEALAAQRDAQAIDFEGAWAQVALAEIAASKGERTKMRELGQSALNKAASRSEFVRTRVQAHLRALDAALAKRRPTTRLYQDSFQIKPVFKGGGGQGLGSLFVCAIEVPPGVTAVAIQTQAENPQVDVDLFVTDGANFPQKNDQVVPALKRARLQSTLSFGPDIVVLRRDTKDQRELLRPGRYSIMVYQNQHPQRLSSPVTLICKYFKPGEKVPFTWQKPPSFQLPSAAALQQIESTKDMILLGEVERAQQVLKELGKTYPKSVIVALRRIGVEKLLGNKAEALSLCRKLLAEHPTEPNTLFMSAETEAAYGDKERGLQLAQKAVRLHPRIAEAWNALIGVQVELKQFKSALETIAKALALGPHAQLTLRNATVLHAAGKKEEAIAVLTKAANSPIVVTDQPALFAAYRQIEAYSEGLAVINDIEKKAGRPLLPLDLERAQIYDAAGRFSESADAYRKILTLLKPESKGPRKLVQNLLNQVEAKIAAKKKKASK